MMFNQMSGKLFRELAEDISIKFPERSELYMGNKETGGYIVKNNKLKISTSLHMTESPKLPVYLLC